MKSIIPYDDIKTIFFNKLSPIFGSSSLDSISYVKVAFDTVFTFISSWAKKAWFLISEIFGHKAGGYLLSKDKLISKLISNTDVADYYSAKMELFKPTFNQWLVVCIIFSALIIALYFICKWIYKKIKNRKNSKKALSESMKVQYTSYCLGIPFIESESSAYSKVMKLKNYSDTCAEKISKYILPENSKEVSKLLTQYKNIMKAKPSNQLS